MSDLSFLTQLLLNGIVQGAIYALIGAGLTVIFGVLGITNIAHGELYMLGAYTIYFLVAVLGFNYLLALPFVALILAIFGALIYKLLLSSTEGDEALQRGLLVTIGLSMVIQNGVIYLLTAQPLTLITPYDQGKLLFMDIHLSLLRLFTVIITLITFISLYLLLTRTKIGKAMRAVTQNKEAALALGIQPKRISMLTVSLGAALAGLGGASIAPIWGIHPTMGMPILFKSFAIITIGGLGSIEGAIVASLLIGIIESFAGGLGSITIQDSVAFIVMILILFLRPQGILGRRIRI